MVITEQQTAPRATFVRDATSLALAMSGKEAIDVIKYSGSPKHIKQEAPGRKLWVLDIGLTIF